MQQRLRTGTLIAVVVAAVALSACTASDVASGLRLIPDAPPPGGGTRALSRAEQALIARDVTARLGATPPLSFVWPRVRRVERAGVTDYCGFVRNRSGAYVPFYVQLGKNPRGRFDRAELRLVGTGFQGLATRRACQELGYDVSRPPA